MQPLPKASIGSTNYTNHPKTQSTEQNAGLSQGAKIGLAAAGVGTLFGLGYNFLQSTSSTPSSSNWNFNWPWQSPPQTPDYSAPIVFGILFLTAMAARFGTSFCRQTREKKILLPSNSGRHNEASISNDISPNTTEAFSTSSEKLKEVEKESVFSPFPRRRNKAKTVIDTYAPFLSWKKASVILICSKLIRTSKQREIRLFSREKLKEIKTKKGDDYLEKISQSLKDFPSTDLQLLKEKFNERMKEFDNPGFKADFDDNILAVVDEWIAICCLYKEDKINGLLDGIMSSRLGALIENTELENQSEQLTTQKHQAITS